ncbi:class I mannose-6-phosphate isomerase [Sphingomonas arantia]|uniref:Class I mannose-6-phosphate isomerase n=1 Tax=Sphingomonas arantia TaxID=1460676 RepID=A0ABW4TTQ7_9SPHN
MPAVRLETKRVEKPWGRETLWAGFDPVPAGGAPVGEIWFQHPDGRDTDLLVKYLFTSQKLSIQVHPDDAQAQARGYPRGKSEAWVILAAEPDATIAIGTKEPMTADELRAASLDGSIDDDMVWHKVKKDDFYYSAAGTVHAIGPGLTLVEVQQNVDLTYRLYDYGSDRELHLDDGVAVSDAVPYVPPYTPAPITDDRIMMADSPKFVLERWSCTGEGTLRSDGRPIWLTPLAGEGMIDGEPFLAGGVWMADGDTKLTLGAGTDLLVLYTGPGANPTIWG